MGKKHKRERKKVVLFLVEGETEITALSESMVDLYESINSEIEVLFCLMQDYDEKENKINSGGDITSKHGIIPSNIEKYIYELFVYPFTQNKRYYPKDILQIVHIVDMDGAYIPDDAIIERECDKARYFDDRIEHPEPSFIRERNELKRANIDHLLRIVKLKVESKSVPYRLFFISCNLDHFLGGSRNMGTLSKIELADSFALQCADDPEFFSNKFLSESFFVDCSWEESWRRIEEGYCSLEPHSNLGQLLRDPLFTVLR